MFIALKAFLESIEHLRFKLRCFGIPMPQGEPTYVLRNNESVVKNTTNVESTFNQKKTLVCGISSLPMVSSSGSDISCSYWY
jgi:hypothetical protein